MIGEFIKAFTLIFLAEMGDKTQIIAMTFATSYLIKDVILGIILGVLANHGLAIVLGGYLSKTVPLDWIQVLAGLMFIIFGLTSLKNDELDEFESSKSLSPIVMVAITFFLGELGDKTQLTALTLSLESNYTLVILMGTTLAMVGTSLVGIYIGSKIGDKVPEVFIKVLSSIIFVVLGTFKFINSLPQTVILRENLFVFLLAVTAIELLLIYRLVDSSRSTKELTPMKKAAYDIHKYTEILKRTIDSICLSENKCGKCSGEDCLIGYTKLILKEAKENSLYYSKHAVDLNKLLKKNYNKEEVLKALSMIIIENEEIGWDRDDNFIVNRTRFAMEYILLGQPIKDTFQLREYLNIIKNIDYSVGSRLEERIKESQNNFERSFSV